MPKTYPIIHWSKCKGWNRPATLKYGCMECGQRFTKYDTVHVKEVQWSYMRGDDEVEFYCDDCRGKANQKIQPVKSLSDICKDCGNKEVYCLCSVER
jgi:hypothetical protein